MNQSDTTEKIRTLLLEALPDAHVDVHDDSAAHAGHAGARGGGGHYQVCVRWAGFAGMSRLARHRHVLAATDALFKTGHIHALALTLETSTEGHG